MFFVSIFTFSHFQSNFQGIDFMKEILVYVFANDLIYIKVIGFRNKKYTLVWLFFSINSRFILNNEYLFLWIEVMNM